MSLEGFPPLLGAGARFLLAVPLLLIYGWWKGVKPLAPKGVLTMLAVTAFLTYALDYGLIYWAEQYLSAGVTAIFFATFPLFTGFFSHWVVKIEKPRVNVYVGLAMGFVGVAVVYLDELLQTSAESRILAATLGVVLGAAGGALATVLIKKYLSGLHPVTLTVNHSLLGGVGLVAGSLLLGEEWDIKLTGNAITGLLYLGIVASALAFSLYYWLLQKASPVTLSTMIFITPLVALMGDWVVYGEAVGFQAVLGMTIIFLGILVTEIPRYRAALRRGGVRAGMQR